MIITTVVKIKVYTKTVEITDTIHVVIISTEIETYYLKTIWATAILFY